MLKVYRDFLPAAPRELNGFFAFLSVPPGDPFPEELHLRKVCGVVWCYVGAEEDAAAAMAPMLDALPAPLLHGVAPMPHADLQSAFDGVYPAGQQWYWRADFVNEIPDEAVEAHVRHGEAMPTWQSTMHLYPIDGAAADVAPADTAWSYRDAKWATVYAGVDPAPENAALIQGWTVGYFDALHPYAAGGAYVNMMMDEGQERVRASYRDNYDRLARIKADLRPRQPLPDQPEHPARGVARRGGRGGSSQAALAAQPARRDADDALERPRERRLGAVAVAAGELAHRRALGLERVGRRGACASARRTA